MNKISIQHVPFHPPIQPRSIQTNQTQTKLFADFLEEATNPSLKLSKHATERMQERNIEISSSEWENVQQKVSEALQKGVKQPLVVLDHAALVISAKNSTVITVVDRDEMKSQIFTNIDGTIVL